MRGNFHKRRLVWLRAIQTRLGNVRQVKLNVHKSLLRPRSVETRDSTQQSVDPCSNPIELILSFGDQLNYLPPQRVPNWTISPPLLTGGEIVQLIQKQPQITPKNRTLHSRVVEILKHEVYGFRNWNMKCTVFWSAWEWFVVVSA